MRNAFDFDTCSPVQLNVTQLPALQSSPSVAGDMLGNAIQPPKRVSSDASAR